MHPEDKSEAALDFNDRYGRTRTRGQTLGKILIIALVITFLGWLFWAANFHSDPQVKVNLISFKTINEKSMGIKFEVTRRNPDQVLECRLVALDIDKYVVGEISVQVPAGLKSQIVNTQIPTRSKSVSASVSRCEVTS